MKKVAQPLVLPLSLLASSYFALPPIATAGGALSERLLMPGRNYAIAMLAGDAYKVGR